MYHDEPDINEADSLLAAIKQKQEFSTLVKRVESNPELIGVHLKRKMNGWTSANDVILQLCGILTVKGGTNLIVEYCGEGTNSI